MNSLKIFLFLITLLLKGNLIAQNTIKIESIQIDSNKFTKGRLVNGIPEGIWMYYKNNKLDKIASYSSGKINGKVIFLDDNGEIIKELLFRDNQLNGDSYFYSKEGNIIAIINYIYDKKYKIILYKIDIQSPSTAHNYLPYNKEDFFLKTVRQ